MKVQFKPNHPVYEGHFPTQAVAPGAMLVTMAIDIVSIINESEYKLTAAKNIKFLKMITPDSNKMYTLCYSFAPNENQNEINFRVQAIREDEVYFKISATVVRSKS